MTRLEKKTINMFETINKQISTDFDNRFKVSIVEFKHSTHRRALVIFQCEDHLKEETNQEAGIVYKLGNKYMLHQIWDIINNFVARRT